jgi:hypothetical protein
LDHQKTRVLTQTSSTVQLGSAQPFVSQEPPSQEQRKRNNTTNPTALRSENLEKLIPLDSEVAEQECELSNAVRCSSVSKEQGREASETQPAETHPRDATHDETSNKTVGDGQYQYYLLKPRTSSSRRVLIPLNSNATLGDCLQGRTLLEFPTIYAFPPDIQQLPEGFMLEEDYQKQEGEEQKEFEELIKELDPGILKRLRDDGRHGGDRFAQEEVGSKAILDVLKKDIGTEL